MPAGPPPAITQVVEICSIGPENSSGETYQASREPLYFVPCNHQEKEVIQCLIVIPCGVCPASWISLHVRVRLKAPLLSDDNAKGRAVGAAFLFERRLRKFRKSALFP